MAIFFLFSVFCLFVPLSAGPVWAAQPPVEPATISLTAEEKAWIAAHGNRVRVSLKTEKSIVALTPEERAWLAKNHTVRARVAHFPPYIFFEKDGITGIVVDYLNLISQRTGVKFELVSETRSWQEAIKSLMNLQGPDLMTSLSPMAEREPYMDFSKPYMISPRMIFTRIETGLISSIDDLSGKTIAVPYGTLVQKKMENYPHIGVKVYDTDLKSIEAVSVGKADAYIGNLINTSYETLHRGFSNLKVVAPTPFGDDVYTFGIRKDWPELTSIIDKGLNSIAPNEKMALRNKYMALRFEHGIRPADVLKWSLIITISVSGIVFLFVFWNRTLAGKVQKRTAELETEVAERTKAQDALRESRDYLKNLTDSMADAVFSTTMPDRKIEWASDTFNVLGYDPGECIGRTTEFLFSDKNGFQALGDEMTRLASEGKEVLRIEKTMRKKNGETFPADISMSFYRVEGEVVSAIGIVRDVSERKQKEEQLQAYQNRLKALASQLTLAEEKERRSIAVALHDQIGQTLALSRIQLAVVRKKLSDDALKTHIDDISDCLRQAARDAQNLIFDLSSPSLNEIGLEAAISEWLEERIAKRYGIKTTFDVYGQRKRINVDIRALLFRNVREVVTNVVKHARSNRMDITMEYADASLKVVIQDDGIGFNPRLESRKGGKNGGFGLFSVRERMTDFGGVLNIESSSGKGCKVTLTAPVSPHDNKEKG